VWYTQLNAIYRGGYRGNIGQLDEDSIVRDIG
jgi:hypothetical protein